MTSAYRRAPQPPHAASTLARLTLLVVSTVAASCASKVTPDDATGRDAPLGSLDAEAGVGSDAPLFADDRVIDALTADLVTDAGPPPVAVHLAPHGPCIVLADGSARCWGWNLGGRVGDGSGGSVDPVLSPVLVHGLANAVRVATENAASAAVLADGEVACWGEGLPCLLDPTATSAAPVRGLSSVTDIAFSGSSACALVQDGTVWCWGSNDVGTIDSVHPAPQNFTYVPPTRIAGLAGITAISMNSTGLACARRNDGAVLCWGLAVAGQLGSETEGPTGGVVQIAGVNDALEVEVGDVGVCIVTIAHIARCWGGLHAGIETCFPPTCAPPAPIHGLTGVLHVRLGPTYACALLDDGSVHCWGDNNEYGMLGTVSDAGSLEPIAMAGLMHVHEIGLASATMFALTDEGTVLAWGSGGDGALGDGTTMDTARPVQIRW